MHGSCFKSSYFFQCVKCVIILKIPERKPLVCARKVVAVVVGKSVGDLRYAEHGWHSLRLALHRYTHER